MSKPLPSRKSPRVNKTDSHRVVKSSHCKPAPLRRKGASTSTPPIRPNSRWTSFAGVGDDRARKIKDIFAAADWKFLCSDAIKCHRRHYGARGGAHGLTCVFVRDRFASGTNNLVLEASFSDATYWLVRIRFPDDFGDDPDIKTSMHSEVATMRLIQERTSIPVPTVFGYNAAQCNPFGYEYMFISALSGYHIAGPIATSVPLKHQKKVADQLADILYQLSTKMVFDRIGRVWRGEKGKKEPCIIPFNASGVSEGRHGKYPVGPFSTSLEHFYILRQNENDAVRSAVLGGVLGQNEKEKWLAACGVFDQGLCSLVLREKMDGPFPLQHVDLQFNNFLFDDEYNITGLIDWSGAQTVPCESFAVCRELVTPPNATELSAARYSTFRSEVQKAWKRREVDGPNNELMWSISDVVGSARAQLIYFSYTYGALRRTVSYAELVGALLHGHGFSLDAVKVD